MTQRTYAHHRSPRADLSERDTRRPDGRSPTRTYTAELVRRAATHSPTIVALAKALQVTPSHISRILLGRVGISEALCVRLADFLGEDRARTLHACGHAAFSDLLYRADGGSPVPRQFSGRHASVHEALDRLDRGNFEWISHLVLAVGDVALPPPEGQSRLTQSLIRALAELATACQESVTRPSLNGADGSSRPPLTADRGTSRRPRA